MNADAYQTAAARTLIDEPDHQFTGNELMLMWCGLGLGGESGEILDLLKKGICHSHGLDRDKLVKELGDCLWYLSGICTLIGVPLSEVFEKNIAKLKERYPNGYTSADSKARVDTHQQITDKTVLDYLRRAGPSPIREIAENLNVDMNRLSARMSHLYRFDRVSRKYMRLDETARRFYVYEVV